jgi:hypothetical protein
MDHWDLALTDGFAQDGEVILFNNAGSSLRSLRSDETVIRP